MRATLALSAALVALASTTLLASALPLDAAPLARRDGVRCQKKYEGVLQMVRLSSAKGAIVGDPNNTVTLAADQYMTLSVDEARLALVQTRFQFDLCETPGWNWDTPSEPREYGQVKPVVVAEDVLCVTAQPEVTPGYDDRDGLGPRELYVDACGATNDIAGILQRQWFRAELIDPAPGNLLGEVPRVELSLEGNPNLPYSTDQRPQVTVVNNSLSSFNFNVAAVPLQGPSPIQLALYDVQIVS